MYYGRLQDCFKILTWVGAATAQFHSKYNGSQHGDLHISNIFVDEANQSVTFIDLGGMLPSHHSNVYLESDVQHFIKSLRLISFSWGEQAIAECVRNFERGYMSASD